MFLPWLIQHPSSNTKTLNPNRHPAIDGNLVENGSDFRFAYPIFQGPLQMKPPFLHPVKGGDHGQVEHRAGLFVEGFIPPNKTPSIFAPN